ncbi:MAG TPA: hypothetical protein PLB87_12845, partial [Prolixibacteraceae bacterium]|nr:hypothetical protein [Prolixibacteraceae bacterium]
MIHIFTSELTYRLDYSCRLLFETILGDEVALYTNKEVFQRNSGVKINYSTQEDVEGLPLKPHPLLFETDIKAQKIEVFEWDSLIAFFRVEDSFLPFDIFAASFYLVSRYEEYLSGKRDRHQRFLSRGSLANQQRFLEKPLVNCWTLKMAGVIEQNFEGYSFVRPSFSYLPT